MSVTVLHYIEGDAFGGAERSLLHLLAHTDRAAFEPLLVLHPSTALRPVLREAAALGVPAIEVPRMRGVLAFPAAMRFAARIRGRGQILHAHLTWALGCSWAILAAGLSSIPSVATVQLFLPDDSVRLPRLTRRFVPGRVARYVAVSPHVAEALHDALGVDAARIDVVPNGIPQTARTAAERAQRRGEARRRVFGEEARTIALVVARLERQKGHGTLLAAAADVPGVLFALAGAGEDRGALERQAASLGLSERVVFLGHRPDVPDLLAAADLFVLPSTSEGLPLALLEAAAAGLPIVATDIGGNRDVVRAGETGLLVPAGDPAALAAAIRRLATDPSYARGLGESAAARFDSRYTAAAMAKGVERAYERVLRGPGA